MASEGFIYFECSYCGFSSVQKDDFKGRDLCPECEEDCGHAHPMQMRPARDDDKPEGFDARLGTHAEQIASRGGQHDPR